MGTMSIFWVQRRFTTSFLFVRSQTSYQADFQRVQPWLAHALRKKNESGLNPLTAWRIYTWKSSIFDHVLKHRFRYLSKFNFITKLTVRLPIFMRLHDMGQMRSTHDVLPSANGMCKRFSSFQSHFLQLSARSIWALDAWQYFDIHIFFIQLTLGARLKWAPCEE